VNETWRIASFSALASGAARREASVAIDDEPRPDHDAIAARGPESSEAMSVQANSETRLKRGPERSAEANATPFVPRDDDILAFPRGAAAGECLHRLFELADFRTPESWPRTIERALRERPVPADRDTARRMPAMMARLLADAAATELAPDVAPGFTLAALDPVRKFVEWPFLFAAPSLDLPSLRRLLSAHGYPDVALESSTIAGFVKGFIDMIVEDAGRYWIVDWKSNHLGMNPDHYGEASLEAAMTEHAYHLQALLYTVALHRYLTVRMRGYDYDRHIGGYLYVFLRGVRPEWREGNQPAGVHFRKPARALVQALDRLMGATRVEETSS
jgi:exodeoxyribonuclease V beta subunit